MKPPLRRIIKSALVLSATLSVLGVTNMPKAHADSAQASVLFNKMTDFLSKENVMSFKYDTNLQIVTKDGQKLTLASSNTATVNKPNQIRATRHGGFANIELFFDGTTVSALDKENNRYAQVDIPGTIDNLIEQLRSKYKMPLPAADLLLSDFHAQFMPLVLDVKDLGSGVIRGEECDHVAYRLKEVDVEVWISQGARPYPCRLSIASKTISGSPEYTIDFSDWKTGKEVAPVDFSFTPPSGAKKVAPDELVDFDELPDFFKTNTTRGAR